MPFFKISAIIHLVENPRLYFLLAQSCKLIKSYISSLEGLVKYRWTSQVGRESPTFALNIFQNFYSPIISLPIPYTILIYVDTS